MFEIDKPILLSIGYSACHWCHVMAHESFEDEETANIMNPQLAQDETVELNPKHLKTATQQLHQSFDLQFGGFGNAPNFSHPSNLEHLLRQHLKTNCIQNQAINMVDLTLNKMALGGLYDQFGGGFYRYSVDRKWMTPHFEKMLYDNGLLLTLYSQIWQITRELLYQKVAIGTAEWVIEEMQSPEGGYYSSLDADSEGIEEEILCLGKRRSQFAVKRRGICSFCKIFWSGSGANFGGKWYLRVMQKSADEKSLAIYRTSQS